MKNKYNQSKNHAGNALTYEKYSELLLLDSTIHDKKSKQNNKFSSKYWQNIYDIEKLPIGKDDISFNIDSYVGIIKEYDYKKLSIYLCVSK